MHKRPKHKTPTGPALRGEHVSELWVWIWSTIEEATGEARDEALRLSVAFDRAIASRRGVWDHRFERFARDQDPVSTARLAHYLVTRTRRWLGTADPVVGLDGIRRRLWVLAGASALFGRLLGATPSQLEDSFERLEIRLPQGSVFHPWSDEGVVVESIEEGPALPAEREQRDGEARARRDARWAAEKSRPRKERVLTEERS